MSISGVILKWNILLFLLILSIGSLAQKTMHVRGQVSLVSSYAPDNELEGFIGARYIPEIDYGIQIDSVKGRSIDFEASANLSGSSLFSLFDDATSQGSLQPYRLWARYSSPQFELRAGLQKIDFGSASLLRPLQWFNQIDPRDPLQLTNGVYGILGRYYFLNNSNVWFWSLIGNTRTRGFDILETNKNIPEFGSRMQYPTKKGEIALSYHYRNAMVDVRLGFPTIDKIPEHRFSIDGKWDLAIGFWFEAAVVHKEVDLGTLTNQVFLNVGADYTFGIGNGLHVVLEHLTTGSDNSVLGFENKANVTGATISYPIGFFDNLSSVYLYNWTSKDIILNMIYNHEFEHISGYLMAFYNPTTAIGFQQNDLVNQFAGPGIRVMLVYNY